MLSRSQAAEKLESHLRDAHKRSIAKCATHDDVDRATDCTLENNCLYEITESGVKPVECVTRSDARYLRPSAAMLKRVVEGA